MRTAPPPLRPIHPDPLGRPGWRAFPPPLAPVPGHRREAAARPGVRRAATHPVRRRIGVGKASHLRKRLDRSWHYTSPIDHCGESAKAAMRGHPYRARTLADDGRHGAGVQARHHPEHDDLCLIRGQCRYQREDSPCGDLLDRQIRRVRRQRLFCAAGGQVDGGAARPRASTVDGPVTGNGEQPANAASSPARASASVASNAAPIILSQYRFA